MQIEVVTELARADMKAAPRSAIWIKGNRLCATRAFYVCNDAYSVTGEAVRANCNKFVKSASPPLLLDAVSVVAC